MSKIYSDDDAIAFIHGLLSAIVSSKDDCLARLNGDVVSQDADETDASESETSESETSESETSESLQE